MAKVDDKNIQEVYSCLDEKSGYYYFYIPYAKNDGKELDYLEIVLTSNGPSINVTGFDKDPKKATLSKIINAGNRTIDDEEYFAFQIKNSFGTSVVNLPITIKDNAFFLEYFKQVATNKLKDYTEVKRDKVPTFTTISKEFKTKESESLEEELKTEKLGPKKIEGNLVYKNKNISYVFLPYKTGEKDSHLVLIQYEGNTYVNIKGLDETNKEKTTTCQVFSAKFEKVDEQELLSLNLEVNGKARTINMPISKEGNETLLTDLNSILSKSTFDFTEIEVYDCPRVSNPNFDEKLNKDKPKAFVPLEEQKLVRSKRKGQELQEQTITLGKESIYGLSQEIDSEKLGLKTPQKLTLLDSSSYKDAEPSLLKNVLFMVTHDSSSLPIAVFSKDVEKVDEKDVPVVKFKISKSFLDEFLAKEENKSLELPEGKLEGDFVTYEIEKLKLSQDSNIQDMQIRGANPDFAVLFSALGLQIVDKSKNLGIYRNNETPFNIGVSTDFISTVMKKEEEKDDADKKLSYDRQGVGYDALLIARIQLERKKSLEPNKVISITIPEGSPTPEERLYSVPLVIKDKEGVESQQYLNIRTDSSGKSYAYMHITGEGVKSAKIPRFYEIDIAHLEESSTSTMEEAKNPSLYLGLKDGKDVVRVNIDIDYEKNAQVLKALKQEILDEEFKKTIHGEEIAEPLFEGNQRNIGGENFVIYPIPKENSADILSLSDTAILSRKIGEPEPEKSLPKSPIIPDFPIIDRERTVVGGKKATKEDDEKLQDDFKPEDIKWKEKLEKPKSPKKKGTRNVLIGFFALCTFLSIIVPFFAIGSVIFAGAAVINEVKPWLVSISNDLKEKRYKKQHSYNPGKDKVKEKEKQYSKIKEKLSVKRNKNAILNEKRERILNDKKITDKKRQKQLEKIDKKISKNKEEISKLQVESSEKEKEISVEKVKQELKDRKDQVKFLKKENRKASKIEKANVSDLEKDLGKSEKEYKLAVDKKAKLENEKAELASLEMLEKAESERTLTEEEKEKLKKLRAKFGKKKSRKKDSDYDKEISDTQTQIDDLKEKKDLIEKAVYEKKTEAEKNSSSRKDFIDSVTSEIEKEKDAKSKLKEDIKDKKKEKKSVTVSEAVLEDYTPVGWDLPEEEKDLPEEEKKKKEKPKDRERERGE